MGRLEAAAEISSDLLTFRSTADLKDFFRTGQLGPLRLGMRREEVESILGETNGWFGNWGYDLCPLGKAGYAIWIYSGIELYFGQQSNQLCGIYNDHIDVLGLSGTRLKLDAWIFEQFRPPSKQQFIDALNDEGISFVDNRGEYFGTLMLESGVRVAYEYKDDSIGVIYIRDESYDD